MKHVVRFIATDGSEFDTETACIDYENLFYEIQAITNRLPKTEIHGADYVQLDPETVLSVQHDLVAMFERLYPSMADQHTRYARTATYPVGMSMIGRYIDDCQCTALRGAWRRIQRIDTLFREYEQPYYAIQSNRRRGAI